MNWFRRKPTHGKPLGPMPALGPRCASCGGTDGVLHFGLLRYCASCRSRYDECSDCGHARMMHQVLSEGYYRVWDECYACHPQRLAAPGVPIAMNDWWAEAVRRAQHRFVEATE